MKRAAADVVVFVHIPKAAGTSLRAVLERQYRSGELYTVEALERIQEFAALPQTQRDRYRCIQGHLHFGMHRLLSKPCCYLTMLRDPRERVVSQYYYLWNSRSHPEHSRLRASGRSLAECVDRGLHLMRDNEQVRYLAGVCPTRGVTDGDLAAAKQHVQALFGVAGLAEQFDESLLLMADHLGWSLPYYERRNTNRGRPGVGALDQRTRTLIEARNELDGELYEFVQGRLSDRIRSQGPDFQRRLEAFRRANARHGPFFGTSRASLWRHVTQAFTGKSDI